MWTRDLHEVQALVWQGLLLRDQERQRQLREQRHV